MPCHVLRHHRTAAAARCAVAAATITAAAAAAASAAHAAYAAADAPLTAERALPLDAPDVLQPVWCLVNGTHCGRWRCLQRH
jgi:hypothetical protein